ncbi:MAG: prephenate dehydrogenase/arogenate dehydrogenase family protein [Leptospiraceae bacterium]|nr:prephenate dehydrogenase/arogenate dehydrogenase family protein [Leptospiraceae bacterium]
MPENASAPYQRILIYGMGMMGSSLASAVQRTWPETWIESVVRSESSAAFIKEFRLANAVQVHTDVRAIQDFDLQSFDLVVLGIPPAKIIEMVPHLPITQTLITDMSSTRRQVHAAFDQRPAIHFIGSHPMCGSEKQGPQAAQADLFHDKLCLLIENPSSAATTVDLQLLRRFWSGLGMLLYTMSSGMHDEVLAYLSHAPHLISSLLTLWAGSNQHVASASKLSPIPISGGGFKSMSRIAGSNPEMWNDVLQTNRDHILGSLQEFHSQLGRLIQLIQDPESGHDWQSWFQKSRQERDQLCNWD